jgi:hypothetical protein
VVGAGRDAVNGGAEFLVRSRVDLPERRYHFGDAAVRADHNYGAAADHARVPGVAPERGVHGTARITAEQEREVSIRGP